MAAHIALTIVIITVTEGLLWMQNETFKWRKQSALV